MNLEKQKVDDALFVKPDGERLDAAASVAFKDAMRDLAEDAPKRIVLNLEHIEFLDSSGLGAVVGSMKLLQPDHKLELANLQPAVAKVFKLTRMDKVFVIHDTDAPEQAHAG